MSARITAVNLRDVEEFLSAQPATARRSARLAINSVTSRKAVPQMRRAMREEAAFPKGYLEDKNRFGQQKRRSEEHTSELQSLMRISYAVFCLKKKNTKNETNNKSSSVNTSERT